MGSCSERHGVAQLFRDLAKQRLMLDFDRSSDSEHVTPQKPGVSIAVSGEREVRSMM